MKENAVEMKTAKRQVTERQAAEKQVTEMPPAMSWTTVRKLEEMNLLDDFLFGSVVAYPEIGEKFVKSLLKTIFGREFKHLSVTAQKVLYGADRKLHGARLDVYLERDDPEGRAAVYDIEPDRKDAPADIRALPRRVRFYHGKIAARSLNSGADYDELKDVVVIMILPFDPFGLKRMVYTVKNRCVEEPGMEYEDGASTLFLYTKGTEGVPNEALKQLLHYMEDTRYENAVSEELREIHRMVETVRKDPEVGGMRIQIVEDNIRMAEKITEQSEEIERQSEKITKQSEKITEQSEEIERQSEKITEQSEEIERQSEKITELSEENTRQSEEITKLREEINRIRENEFFAGKVE